MKLKKLGSNMTELELNDGTLVLFSYETPVAARVDTVNDVVYSGKILKTSKKWSPTTSKHINKWLSTPMPHTYIVEVDQSVLDDLVK